MVSPVFWRNDRGEEISLAARGPALVERDIRESVARARECEVARFANRRAGCDEGSVVYCADAQALRRWLATQKGHSLTHLERGVLRAYAARVLWTRRRLADVGFAVDAKCALCGEQRDTALRRLWQCSAAGPKTARGPVATPELVAEAEREHGRHPVWATGWA